MSQLCEFKTKVFEIEVGVTRIKGNNRKRNKDIKSVTNSVSQSCEQVTVKPYTNLPYDWAIRNNLWRGKFRHLGRGNSKEDSSYIRKRQTQGSQAQYIGYWIMLQRLQLTDQKGTRGAVARDRRNIAPSNARCQVLQSGIPRFPICNWGTF